MLKWVYWPHELKFGEQVWESGLDLAGHLATEYALFLDQPQ